MIGYAASLQIFMCLPLASGAQAHQRQGTPCSAVQWGAWSGVGMVAGSAAVLGRMRRAGVAAVAPAAGVAALAALLAAARPPAVLAAVPFLWDAFLRRPELRRQPFFSEFLPPAPAATATATADACYPTGSALGLSGGDAQLQRQQQAGQPRLGEAAVAAAVAAAVSAALGDDVSHQAPLLQVRVLSPPRAPPPAGNSAVCAHKSRYHTDSFGARGTRCLRPHPLPSLQPRSSQSGHGSGEKGCRQRTSSSAAARERCKTRQSRPIDALGRLRRHWGRRRG